MSDDDKGRKAFSEPAMLALTVVDKIGLLGVLALLWSVITCCALVGGEARVVMELWDDLFTVWIVIAILAVVAAVGVSVADRMTRQAEAAGRLHPVVEREGTGDSPTGSTEPADPGPGT